MELHELMPLSLRTQYDRYDQRSNPVPTVITNPTTRNGLICGECDRPDYLHPFTTQWPYCNRSAESIASGFLTERYTELPDGEALEWEDYREDETIHVNYDGPGISLDSSKWATEPDVFPTDETLDAYHDKYPEECTSLFGQPTPDTTYSYEPEKRTAYIEDTIEGTTQKLIDFEVTRNYHKKLLNIFVDNRGSLRLGSIYFTLNTDQTVTAKCIQDNCFCQLTTSHDFTRAEQEDFIYACIRHGNNHAPAWLRNRTVVTETTTHFGAYASPTLVSTEASTHYKVHGFLCDLDCDLTSPKCNENAVPWLTPSESIEFLEQHRKVCTSLQCTCFDWIIEAAYQELEGAHQ